jgi:hypothetical protein
VKNIGGARGSMGVRFFALKMEERHQLLKRVGLAVGLMEVSGGMVGVKAGEQVSLEC